MIVSAYKHNGNVFRVSSKLGSFPGSGFFSVIHYIMNNYIYCKKNNVDFFIDSAEWLFKYKDGWTDYFEDNKMIFSGITNNDHPQHFLPGLRMLGEFPIFEYKAIIGDFYIYNQKTKEAILDAKIKYNIPEKPDTYDCLFIRRGDKLIREATYIHSSKYLDLLLQKNPVCKTVFLQTDDYNCYLELLEYINEKKYDIQVITMCDEKTKGGMVIFDMFIKNDLTNANTKYENKETEQYISTVIDNLIKNKPVDKMTPDEIYEHTLTMIIGIDIAIHSNICVTDYTSNIARFIKLSHDNIENVYDVLNPDVEIDLNKIQCPCGGF